MARLRADRPGTGQVSGILCPLNEVAPTGKIIVEHRYRTLKNRYSEIRLTSSALKQLIDLQKSMYDRAILDARESSGSDLSSISKYQKAFEASLPETFQAIPVRRLLESIDSNPTLLFGDFHSHKQSQRAFLRLIRMYQNRPDHAPIVIALEMFRSKDQPHINAWLGGHIEDDEFLSLVDYDNTWGFPWINYKPILEYCKLKGIQAIGINSDRGGKDQIEKRDEHSAKIISKVRRSNPNARIFCMIGEFHLANSQLPAQLLKNSRGSTEKLAIRVYANLDKYFFALKPDRIHRQDEYLDLGDDAFCVINSPPWIKWQSQALWAEMRRLGSVKYLIDTIAPDDVENDLDVWDDAQEDSHEDSLDLDYHLLHLQRQIAGFLGVSAKSEWTERFHVITGSSLERLEEMTAHKRAVFLARSSRDGFAIDYDANILYMPEITINNMAAAAGQMLLGSISGLSECEDGGGLQLVTECLKYTYGYFANKILNPRFPIHNEKKIESYLLSTRGRRLSGLARQRRDVAKETLTLSKWIRDHWTPQATNMKGIPTSIIMTDIRSSHAVAKNLAQLIAEPICLALVKGRLDTTDVKKWFLRECKSEIAAKSCLAAMISLSHL
jgi:uncharacterized iron-regulated protein